MKETFEQAQLTQILYEISMSIGTSVELRAMLKPSLSTILKKLNCVSGGVYQKEKNRDSSYQFNAAYTIPRRPERNATYQEALTLLTDSEAATFLPTLPIVGQSKEGNYYHILELPNFGLLILIKNKEALADPIIKSLAQLLNKLAAASIACANEAKLRQNEERYRTFTNATFDGIMVHDGPIVTEINPALAATIAYEPEELIGKNIFDFLDSSCHDLARANAENLTLEPYELLAVLKDGTRLPVEVTDREYTEDGRTYRVTAVRDLSHQKQLETELKSLVERRTRQVEISTQVAQAIAAAANLDDLYQRIVTEVKEQFGYYHTQLLRYDTETDTVQLIAGYGEIGKQMYANGHQLPMGKGLIGTAAATGQSVLRPDLADDPDWTPNPLLPDTKSEIAVPIKLGDEILGVLDVQDNVIGALTSNDQLLLEGLCGQIAVAVDTTRLTTELQETSTFLNTVIDNIPNMIFVKEAEELRFIQLNKVGQRYLGATLEEIAGKNDFDFFPDEQATFFINKDREVLASEQPLDIPEETIQTPFGSRILHTTKVSVRDADGKPKYLVGISNDITERKEAENALIQSEKNLHTFLEQQKKLHEIGLELSKIKTSDDLYREAIKRGHKDLGFDRIGLYLLDAESKTVRGTFGINTDGKLCNESTEVHVLADEPWLQSYLYENERLVINEDADLHQDGEVVGHGWNLTATLWSHGKPIGLFFSDNLISQQPLQPHQPELLSAYSATIANLIERQRAATEREHLLQSTEQQAENLAHLNKMSTALNQAQTIKEIYKLAGEYTQKITADERASLALLTPDKQMVELFGLSGVKGAVPLGAKIPVQGSGIGLAIQENRQLSFPEDASMETYIDTKQMVSQGLNSAIVTPIVVAGQPIGSLNVASQTVSDSAAQKKTLMQQIASLVASAIQVRQAQERTDTILQSVTLPLLISRVSDGHILYTNIHLANMVGVPLEELIGNQTPNFYVNEEDRTTHLQNLEENGYVENHEMLFQRSNQEQLWGMLNARIIEFEGEPAIITSIIDITGRKASEAAIERQAEELQIVADLSTQVSGIEDPQKMLEVVVQETQQRFGLYHCHIFLMDDAHKNLRIRACGWHQDAPEYGTHGTAVLSMNSKKSLVVQAASTRQAVIVNDVLNDPNWLPNELLPETRSEMAVPLIVGNTVLGVLDVQSSEPNHFTEADTKIQSTLASQIAVALENARAVARTQAALDELSAVTRQLTRESWDEYLTGVAEVETGYMYDLGELTPVMKEPVAQEDGETAVSPTNGHLSQSLMVHGESIGHLTVFNEADTEQLGDDAALIMAAVAEQLSARVENIRLTDQTQQALAQTQDQAQRLGLLNEISAEMSNVDTLNQVFDIIFARIPKLLNVDRVSLSMLQSDGETLEIIGHAGEIMDAPTGTKFPLAGTPMAQALHDNRIIASNVTSPDNMITSTMIAPIFSAGQAIGTLNIGSKKANGLTSKEEALLQQLTTMLSSVIENKQLLAAAQARAERERQVRTITDKIRRGTDREAILKIAQKEISTLIGAKQSAAQLGTKTQLLDRIQQTLAQSQQDSD